MDNERGDYDRIAATVDRAGFSAMVTADNSAHGLQSAAKNISDMELFLGHRARRVSSA
jgi:hypothetical protein